MQSSPHKVHDLQLDDLENAELHQPVPVERRRFRDLMGLWRPKTSPPIAVDSEINALLAFPSEAGSRVEPTRIGGAPTLVRAISTVGAIIVLAGLGALAMQRYGILQPTRPGTLTIDTRPGDSEVLIDGEHRGTTPLTLSLTPGAHTITVRNGSDERVVPLTIASGAEISQYFEMKAVEPTARRRPAVHRDRSARRARDRRRKAARNLAGDRCRSDAGRAQDHASRATPARPSER